MSENAKKKSSGKQSPEELLNEAVANHESSFERWQSYHDFGGQDPFWADGCNMNLIRNHIIYYKRTAWKFRSAWKGNCRLKWMSTIWRSRIKSVRAQKKLSKR